MRVVLPFKDQSSANYVKQHLNNLSSKLNVTVQPVFVSQKLEQQLKHHEVKPPIVNQQWIVYQFQCNLCDAGYVGYTHGHLHERVEGHTKKASSIYKHYNLQHNCKIPERFIEQFRIITKCSGKFDCLVKGCLTNFTSTFLGKKGEYEHSLCGSIVTSGGSSEAVYTCSPSWVLYPVTPCSKNL